MGIKANTEDAGKRKELDTSHHYSLSSPHSLILCFRQISTQTHLHSKITPSQYLNFNNYNPKTARSYRSSIIVHTINTMSQYCVARRLALSTLRSWAAAPVQRVQRRLLTTTTPNVKPDAMSKTAFSLWPDQLEALLVWVLHTSPGRCHHSNIEQYRRRYVNRGDCLGAVYILFSDT